MDKFIVTFAPPTPNGGLHVGHLSGPYIAADVFTRARRALGDEVVFVSYSDDYQSYLERKARELGRDAPDLAAENADIIRHALERSRIFPDIFLSAMGSRHFLDAVARFRSAAGNFIRTKVSTIPYCEECEVWGYEAYGRGTCAHCGASTDHSQCEVCASPPDITGVSGVLCVLCRRKMTPRSIKREFLDFTPFVDYVKEIYQGQALRPMFDAFVKRMLAQDALEWPIDRPGDIGIPCDTSETGIIHTWFAGIAGYHAATAAIGREDVWSNKAARLACFVGFDCSFSHAIVYPTLLAAADIHLSKTQIFTNAFLKLNGKDFSTSRGIAIWANDILEVVEPDYLRFYLASRAPENEVGNFDTSEFVSCVRSWFGEDLPQVLARSLAQNINEIGDRAPASFEDLEVWESLRRKWCDAVSPELFSLLRISDVLQSGLRHLVRLSNRTAPELGFALAAWAAMAQPIMPQVSADILAAAGIDESIANAWLRGQAPLAELRPAPRMRVALSGKLPTLSQITALVRGC